MTKRTLLTFVFNSKTNVREIATFTPTVESHILPYSSTGKEVLEYLIHERHLLAADPSHFQLALERTNSTIGLEQTLSDAGVTAYDRIHIVEDQFIKDLSERRIRWARVRSTSFSPTDIATITSGIVSVAQLVLMVVSMWPKAKEEKKKGTPHAKQQAKGVLDEVKSIIVWMSDGTSLRFQSWLADPEQLKRFLELYQPTSSNKPLPPPTPWPLDQPHNIPSDKLPPVSPWPESVEFYLTNGSVVPFDISYDSGGQSRSQEQLNRLIEYMAQFQPR